MGMSSSHPSPGGKWRLLGQLYSTPGIDPKAICDGIADAIGDETFSRDLADEAVVESFNFILDCANNINDKGIEQALFDYELPDDISSPLLAIQSSITDQLKDSIAVNGFNSIFGEIAVLAVSSTIDEIFLGKEESSFTITTSQIEDNLTKFLERYNFSGLGSKFLEVYLSGLFEYYTSRDTHNYLGNFTFPTFTKEEKLYNSYFRVFRRVLSNRYVKRQLDRIMEVADKSLDDRRDSLNEILKATLSEIVSRPLLGGAE